MKPKFKIGDIVRVLPITRDPLNMQGRRGKILGVEYFPSLNGFVYKVEFSKTKKGLYEENTLKLVRRKMRRH